jgi:hypothetical protein
MSSSPWTDERVRETGSLKARLIAIEAERDALKQEAEDLASANYELERQVHSAVDKHAHAWGVVLYGPGSDEPDDSVPAVISLNSGTFWRKREDRRWFDVAFGQTYFETWSELTIHEGPLMSFKTDFSRLKEVVDKADNYKQIESDINLWPINLAHRLGIEDSPDSADEALRKELRELNFRPRDLERSTPWQTIKAVEAAFARYCSAKARKA